MWSVDAGRVSILRPIKALTEFDEESDHFEPFLDVTEGLDRESGAVLATLIDGTGR